MTTITRLALLGALVLPGCVVRTDHDDGALVLDWTIDDSDDPAECRQGDVDAISIHIETFDGDSVGDFEADCEDFETSIPLPHGDYHADVVLLDFDGHEITTAISTDDFPIDDGRDTPISLDFPASSFR